ncbi:hypothetical protein N799_09835 [Lysobacter arseniciresistens ZS79]|uniref:Uncharacterized protein n=1 Tax=Lysobacter arseniciresistens ZS79 TaxID=913325 RepID=A0A0A0EVL9_9GAMM|nr:hypothetical protein N799_09835 [Lysobacter arseniciresistens ZS79]
MFGVARLRTDTSDLTPLSRCRDEGKIAREYVNYYWGGAASVGADADDWHVWLRGCYPLSRCAGLEVYQEGKWTPLRSMNDALPIVARRFETLRARMGGALDMGALLALAATLSDGRSA